jgi:capsular exopolysaccharide synthesis family protein
MDSTQAAAPEARLHFLDYWRVIRTRKAIVFAVFLLVVLVASVVTYFQPNIYQSVTRIQVEQERPSVAVFEQQQLPSYDPYFLQTQYEIIQSQKILYPVIQRLELQKHYAEGGQPLPLDNAFKRLKANLAVRRYRDTSLIEIAVQDKDPAEAAEIANTIAELFESDRLDVKRQQTARGLEKLRDEIVQQQARLQAAQQKVEDLRKQLDVPVFGSDANESTLTEQNIQQLESRLIDARVEAASKETRLKELQKLSPKQLSNAITTIISDPNVQTLLQNLTDAELKLEVLKEDYGPDHPNVLAAIAQRDKLQEQLDARLEGVMRGFEVEYQMAEAQVDVLQKQMDDLKNSNLSMENDKFLPFRNAQREVDMEQQLYQTLKQRIQQTSIEMEVPRSPVEVVDRAEVSLVPVKPNIWLNVSLGAVVGLLLGVGLAFFIELLDTSVKRMEDVERHLGLPVLGVIAQQAGLLGRDEVSPAHVEAYRMLRTNIEFAKGNDAVKSLCVLSAGPGEGKSFTIANLAFTFAQHGARVLVVDSDLRRPGVHKYLGANNEIGLAEYLSGEKTVDQIIQATRVPNVSIISSGGGAKAKSALPLLTSQRMEQLIREVGARFDIVLYDTPPVLGVSDAAVVAREVGTAILLIQHRRYPRAMSSRARQVIENAGGKLLGVVVNNVNVGQDETYYYYHDSYEHYMRGPEGKSQPAAADKKSTGDEIKLQGKY